MDAERHIKCVTEWIDTHEVLSISDYTLINTLNKETTDLSIETRKAIEIALKEVPVALEACEEESVGMNRNFT